MKPSGTAAGRSRAMRLVGWLAVTSMLFGALVGPNVSAVLAAPGAIYTSNADGSEVNANIYEAKEDVYLTGGPCGETGHLDEGDYYFEVTSPNGILLSEDSIGERGFHVNAAGYISSGTGSHVTHDVTCTNEEGITLQLLPYADTPNNGGEYKLTIAEAESVLKECPDFDEESTSFVFCNKADSKSDNFKVLEGLGQGLVFFEKLIDEDGDAATTGDQTPAEGWEFSVDLTEGEIIDSELVTGQDGFGGAFITFPGDSTGVTVTEVQQDGYELIDGDCVSVSDETDSELSPQALHRSRSLQAQAAPQVVGKLDGTSFSFAISDGEVIWCTFVNAQVEDEEEEPSAPTPTPSFSGGVEGITGRPTVTLPPTDGLAANTAPASETWRILLVAMAVLLAGILVVTPKPVSRRR